MPTQSPFTPDKQIRGRDKGNVRACDNAFCTLCSKKKKIKSQKPFKYSKAAIQSLI